MNTLKPIELNQGLGSSYGSITIERILARYHITLSAEVLKYALSNSNSFINQLLTVPLKNVFNGIIMQQAKDYMLYAQKLFIDYLLSGETTQDAAAPGGAVREDLETARQELTTYADNFYQLEQQHYRLIYETQHLLIENMAKWKKSNQQAVAKLQKTLSRNTDAQAEWDVDKLTNSLFILLSEEKTEDIHRISNAAWEQITLLLNKPLQKEQQKLFLEAVQPLMTFDEETMQHLNDLKDRSQSMNMIFKKYRKDFYAFIIKANELLQNLPEYRNNPDQSQANREEILFDPKLGEG